ALARALLKLAEEPVEALHHEVPLRAPYLDGLLHPDDVKQVLRWLDDPSGFRATSSPQEWAAFVALCQSRYGFHPEQDGPITAARLLGQRNGPWDTAWKRFAEAPAAYQALPEALRQARPTNVLPLFDSPESWPQENEQGETALRQALLDLARLDAQAARDALFELEKEHGPRRDWVWARLGRSPLAVALVHLAALALATVETPADLGAVQAALRTMYRPWLEAGAHALQQAVAAGDPCQTYVAMS